MSLLQNFALHAAGSRDGTVDRRDFVKLCTAVAAALGLPVSTGRRWAEAAETAERPSVIWLAFQQCTGCTESLLRTSHPGLAELILDLISLDYNETLNAAAGHQVEEALAESMQRNAGKYVLVVEGAIPTKDGGIYCKIGGKTAPDLLAEAAASAGAIIAIGSCASWGGIPSSAPNPTGAKGVQEVLPDATVVNIPGCPANPYNLLGTVLQYVSFGTLPALDEKNRPKFAYQRVIHENCPRRAHFDAGRMANQYGDEGHRQGYCLYKLGCKGPVTHAPCATLHFGEVTGAWPIGIGAPCIGCTEEEVVFTVPMHAKVDIFRPTPPDTYPPIDAPGGELSAAATGVGGLVVGGLIGGGLMAAKKLGRDDDEDAGEGGTS